MNKFIVLLAFALCASASPVPDNMDGESQSVLNPTDSEETAGLIGNMKLFSDFCISQRDFVYGDVKKNTNAGSARIYAWVFNSAEAVGQDAISTTKMAVDRLSGQLTNPDAQIAEAADEIERAVADGQKRIQEEQTVPKTLLSAFMTTVGATKSVVQARISAGLESVTSLIGIPQAIAALDGACKKIAEYSATMESNFAGARDEVAAKDGSLASVNFEQVPCTTTKRIIYADGLCKIARAVQAPVNRMRGARRS